jgi:hypothetical protein
MITLTAVAHCLARECEWTAAGSMAEVDKASDRHTRQAKHATATVAAMAGNQTAGRPDDHPHADQVTTRPSRRG